LSKNMSVEYLSDFSDQVKPKYLEKSLSECHVVHHQSHIDYWLWLEYELETDSVRHGTELGMDVIFLNGLELHLICCHFIVEILTMLIMYNLQIT